jgi:hypothetical protein
VAGSLQPQQAPQNCVAQFVAQHPANGEYTLIAYIDEVYLCPPCPKGARCKRCIGDNVAISDSPARGATPASEKITVFIRWSEASNRPPLSPAHCTRGFASAA